VRHDEIGRRHQRWKWQWKVPPAIYIRGPSHARTDAASQESRFRGAPRLKLARNNHISARWMSDDVAVDIKLLEERKLQ